MTSPAKRHASCLLVKSELYPRFIVPEFECWK